MPKTNRFFLSLGSNQGDRRNNLGRARALLEEFGLRIRRASSLYRTQPVGYAHQRWFYNQVLEVDASLSPFDLLNTVQDVERLMKRRTNFRNGPRRIDIDILLAGKTVLLTRNLVIPHPRLALRNFVLLPLKEIAPHTVHPILHEDILMLCDKSKDRSVVRKVHTRQPDPQSPPHWPEASRCQALPRRRSLGRVPALKTLSPCSETYSRACHKSTVVRMRS